MDFVLEGEHADDSKFVGVVEQMVASRCYRASRGSVDELGCISCHDPHHFPSQESRVSYYRQRCLSCHEKKGCSLPLAARLEKNKEDSCIACHMPTTGTEVSHAAVTDHRIPRRPAARSQPGQRPVPTPSTLVPFHRDLVDPHDPEVSRNLGVALMATLERGPPANIAREFAQKALPLLEEALKRDEHDAAVLESRGAALWSLGRRAEALTAYEAALTEEPNLETALHAAGKLSLELNRVRASVPFLERAIKVNPWRWEYHFVLAAAYFESYQWERALPELRTSLELEPFYATTRRKLLVRCYVRLGQKEQARAEFESLLKLSPETKRQDLRDWFAAEMP
jgi:Tfp pilus assembly protein PilF